MRIAILRDEVRDLGTPDCGSANHVRFRFSTVRSDVTGAAAEGMAELWKLAEVPDGSRVAKDQTTGEPIMYVPGVDRALAATEVAARFGV